MVKRNPARGRRVPGIELFMECTDEDLSQSQITAQQLARYQYEQALAKIRDAHAMARIGKAKIINHVDKINKVAPQMAQKTSPMKVQPSSNQKEHDRPSSPDIIFVGETPATKSKQPTPPTVHQPQPRSLVVNSKIASANPQQVFKLVNVTQQQQGQWVVKPVANVMPQQQQQTVVQQVGHPDNAVTGTYGMGYKRPLNSLPTDVVARKKLKTTESEDSDSNPDVCVNGNWVPLDEYYYGKMEGDPTYEEEKSEYRFKCWYCNKMLYNNVKAMMHIQGHIDSSKQQNIDLSDLTQCKHCYKQFDTPFEMQTHVDKVHMNNTNVLLCRICDRDHESRQSLTSHMRQYHKACEMPYTCQLCKFRSSMYSDVVDHFKKKHDSSQHLLCLYCLRVFVVKFVSQGWGTTQTYYGHLLKHQSKAQNKKCGLCRLAFFNAAEVKAHKQKHHGSNQKAILGTAAHSSKTDELLIKVPSLQKNSLKSLNAPSVSKVLDFGGTTFPAEVHYHNCFECKMSMGTHDHYRKYVECSMCRFATICSIAYANHMMGFHSGQMSSLNLNIPWERKMDKPMYCLCGFSSRYGNKIANHLVFCMKSSCYKNKPEGGLYIEDHRDNEDVDPRNKPGASLLDALGLVKRRTVTPMYQKTAERSPNVTTPKSKPFDPDYVPADLQGSQKWKSVRLKEPDLSTKKSPKLHPDVEGDSAGISTGDRATKGDNSESQKTSEDHQNTSNQIQSSETSTSETDQKENELLDIDNENSAEDVLDENKSNDVMDDLEEERLLMDDAEIESDDSKDSNSDENKEVSEEISTNEKSTEENEDLLDQNDLVDCENEGSLDQTESVKRENEGLSDQPKLVNCEKEISSDQIESVNCENEELLDESKSVDQSESKSVDQSESKSVDQSESLNKAPDGSVIESDSALYVNNSENNSSEVKTSFDEFDKDNAEENVSEDSEKNDKSENQNLDTEKLDTEENASDAILDNTSVDEKDDKHSEEKNSGDEKEENISSEKEGQSDVKTSNEKESDKRKTFNTEKGQEEKEYENLTEESADDKMDLGDCNIRSSSANSVSNDLEIEEGKTTSARSADNDLGMEEDKATSVRSAHNDIGKDEDKETATLDRSNSPAKESARKSVEADPKKQAKGDNASTSQQGSSSKNQHSKDSHHHERWEERSHNRSRSHDHYSDHSRSHDDRRSHDSGRRSNHYDDRSYHHQGRQDDRNRHGRHDRDRGYYDNRGYNDHRDNRDYNDHRDNRDYHRDDRRNNKGHGYYQGQGQSGYGRGGYHGYR